MTAPTISSQQVSDMMDELERYGQAHVLSFWDRLTHAEQAGLFAQLSSISLPELAALAVQQETAVDYAALAARASSPPAVQADGRGAAWQVSEAVDRGQQALSAGQVACLIVAGGQGTRLGFDKPKGMFPIGPVSGRTLFQFFADRLIAIGQRYGKRIPVYLMTSPATHDQTVQYWEEHDWLGLDRQQVRIFCQGTMPAVDRETGKILMSSPAEMALSPDGHGGALAALRRSGCLDDAAERGIRYLSYGQIDNPLTQLCEPSLLGHHIFAGSEMTTQVVRKRHPTEKVGNVVLADGRVQIIEYSDLPEDAAERTDDQGNLVLWAGNIAVHVFDIQFLQSMAHQAEALPFHRAIKAVPYVDADGKLQVPDKPNAVKFERFIFDLLPHAEHAFVVEGKREQVFAPVKNADDADADTPRLAKQAIVLLARDLLSTAGVAVAEGVQVEIQPQFALNITEAREKLGGVDLISADRYFSV